MLVSKGEEDTGYSDIDGAAAAVAMEEKGVAFERHRVLAIPRGPIQPSPVSAVALAATTSVAGGDVLAWQASWRAEGLLARSKATVLGDSASGADRGGGGVWEVTD